MKNERITQERKPTEPKNHKKKNHDSRIFPTPGKTTE
jgi:hypothetical protein